MTYLEVHQFIHSIESVRLLSETVGYSQTPNTSILTGPFFLKGSIESPSGLARFCFELRQRKERSNPRTVLGVTKAVQRAVLEKDWVQILFSLGRQKIDVCLNVLRHQETEKLWFYCSERSECSGRGTVLETSKTTRIWLKICTWKEGIYLILCAKRHMAMSLCCREISPGKVFFGAQVTPRAI